MATFHLLQAFEDIFSLSACKCPPSLFLHRQDTLPTGGQWAGLRPLHTLTSLPLRSVGLCSGLSDIPICIGHTCTAGPTPLRADIPPPALPHTPPHPPMPNALSGAEAPADAWRGIYAVHHCACTWHSSHGPLPANRRQTHGQTLPWDTRTTVLYTFLPSTCKQTSIHEKFTTP